MQADGRKQGLVELILRFTVLLLVICGLWVPAAHAGKIKERHIRAHIEILASDDFGGRAPGTIGEQKTVDYIKAQWIKAGLKPAWSNEAGEADWFQDVPLELYAPISQEVRFSKGRRNLRFSKGSILLIGADADYSRNNIPLMFAGSGLDGDGDIVEGVEGKAVLMLESPALDTPDKLLPVRARMQALADAGAEAVILVVDVGAWRPAMRQFSKPALSLAHSAGRAPLQGVISTEFAVGLIASAGGDWDKMRSGAYDSGFKGRKLGINGSFTVKSRVERFSSRNVIGKLPGRKPGSGAIMLMGHWDHFGFCGAEGDTDRICNGAVDNASGIAVLIEIARKLARRSHDRDIYFLATTAEEAGLLGAYHFADNPAFPLHELQLVLNLDTTAVAPRGTKVAIIGPEDDSFLRPIVKKLLRRQRRKIDKTGDASIFAERQDGFALVQRGVPTFIVGSAFGDMDRLNAFLNGPYHGADDELTEETQLGGATQDANLHVWLGQHFASKRKFRGRVSGPDRRDGEKATTSDADSAGE